MNREHAMLRSWSAPVSAADCSPLAARLAMSIDRVDPATGVVRLGFAPAGAPSQATIVAMLDFALGFAALAIVDPPEASVTSTLHVESVASTDATSFAADGAVTGSNATTIFTRAALFDDRGVLVALASATQRRVTIPARRSSSTS